MTSLADLVAQKDAKAFYETHGAVPAGKPTHSREGLEYACSCPVCGGTDRASFWPETGRFCCVRGCQAKCSSIYWCGRDLLGMTHQEILAELNIDPLEIDSYGQSNQVKLPLFLTREEIPCKAWQESAYTFCHMAEKCLWSSKGVSALNYLHLRGFKDDTIRAAHLGFCPGWHKAPLQDWGLDPIQLDKGDDPQIKIPTGITIPWYVGSSIWKIQLRRPEPGPDGKKYKEVTGSSDCLYNGDTFQPGQPVCLFESELDALSAQQEAADLAAMIATGSAAKGGHSIALLKQASIILQCFDNDEAGDNGAAEWLKRLPEGKAFRRRPWSHDANDMLKAGQPIRLWIETGLHVIHAQPEETLPPALPIIPPEEQAQTLLQKFEAVNGELCLRDDGIWRIIVPDWWSDKLYNEWESCIFALDAPLKQLLGRRKAA